MPRPRAPLLRHARRAPSDVGGRLSLELVAVPVVVVVVVVVAVGAGEGAVLAGWRREGCRG